MKPSELLVIGLSPRVLALRRSDGEVVWEAKVPSSGVVVTVLVEGTRVYAGSSGEVTCLDLATGAVLWHNPLKGFGVNTVLFAAEHASVATVVQASASAGGAAAAAAAGGG